MLDMNEVIESLQNVPQTEKINWSGMARKLGITQPNGGQVLKEIAQKHSSETTPTTPRTRRSKAKLQGRNFNALPPDPRDHQRREKRREKTSH